jgi:hypothetical protein
MLSVGSWPKALVPFKVMNDCYLKADLQVQPGNSRLHPNPSLNAACSEVRQHAFVMWHGLIVNLTVFVLIGASSLLMPISTTM